MAAVTDSAGNIVATFSYDPWGVPTELSALGNKATLGSWTAPTGGTPGTGLYLLFGGMLYDAACGLYLTRTRAYNPRTGRFMQRDILDEEAKGGYDGFIQGRDAIDSNLYLFTGNNPVNRVDPLGMRWGDTRNWSNWGLQRDFQAFLARLAPDYAAWQRRGLASSSTGRRIIDQGNPAPITGYSPYGETIVYRNPYTGTGYTRSGKGYSRQVAPARANPAPQPPARTGSLAGPGGAVAQRASGETGLTRADIFHGDPYNNPKKNCGYWTNLATQTGKEIYVIDAVDEPDWGAVWQKEKDWIGSQAAMLTFTGGASVLTGKATGPVGFAASALGNSFYFYSTSRVYYPQEVREFCNGYSSWSPYLGGPGF